MNEVLSTLLQDLVAPAITLLLGYWIGKPKAKAEVNSVEEQTQGAELENVKSALVIYRDMIQDLGVKINELRQRVEELEAALLSAEDENKQLKNQLNKN